MAAIIKPSSLPQQTKQISVNVMMTHGFCRIFILGVLLLEMIRHITAISRPHSACSPTDGNILIVV